MEDSGSAKLVAVISQQEQLRPDDRPKGLPASHCAACSCECAHFIWFLALRLPEKSFWKLYTLPSLFAPLAWVSFLLALLDLPLDTFCFPFRCGFTFPPLLSLSWGLIPSCSYIAISQVMLPNFMLFCHMVGYVVRWSRGSYGEEWRRRISWNCTFTSSVLFLIPEQNHLPIKPSGR